MRLAKVCLTLLVLGAACSSSEDDAPAGGASGAGSAGAGSGRGGASSGSAGSGGASGSAGKAEPAAGRAGSSGRSGNGGSAGSTASGGSSGAGAPNAGTAGARAGAGQGGTAGASTGGDAGMAGAPSVGCKRGIAANTAPGPAFSPGVAWWYNWAMKGSDAAGVEFVPMMWGKTDVKVDVMAGASFLLTFNEPNFQVQSNITAQDAAALWPEVEAKARAAGVPIVSPGVNFCGPADKCNNGTSPYGYLKDFFAACTDCQVDYVAVHWYNCDLPSLRDYLEPGGNLEGFEQFGRPLWVTEFSCDGGASVAEQEAYMREAVPYLEAKSDVFRYSWFSADPIPNAKLVADDGSPTELGAVYMGLDQACEK